MRILIDIGHPKDIHTFKNLYSILKNKKHQVVMTCRDREHNFDLLKAYDIDFRCLGNHYITLLGKAYGLVLHEIRLLLLARRFKADVFLSHNSTIAAHVSKILRKPHIAIEDTFNKEQLIFSMPFTDIVLTGDYPHPDLGRKELHYPGYHELAYLHPNVYTPNAEVLDYLGVQKGEKYAIVRFVAWNATHDIGHKGISVENKVGFIELLSQHIKVFISSERELPHELSTYRIKIRSDQMHDAMNFAHLVIGESATMAAESAIMGTPAIYINNSLLGYIKDLAGYGLLHIFSESFEDQKKAFSKAIEIARQDNISIAYLERRDKMLADKIDVTAFLEWFIENYPMSLKEAKSTAISFERFR